MATLLPAEQLRMALEMECRGYALYSRARALTNDPALRALLDDLCREEALHYEMFSAMADGRPQAAGEQNQLAIAMAAEAFYPGGLMQVSAERWQHFLVIRDGIALEGESAEMVRKIIHEEEGHLRTLAQWRDEK